MSDSQVEVNKWLSLKPKSAPGVPVFTNSDEESLSIMPPAARDFFLVVEGISVDVWEQLDGSQTIAKIAKSLAAKYHVEENLVLEEITKFLNDLDEYDLVTT